MKKLLITILAVLLICTFFGCGNQDRKAENEVTPETTVTPSETEPPVLGSLRADLIENLPEGAYREVGRAVTDEGAAKIAVFSDAALRDITISQVEMDFETTNYTVVQDLLKEDLLLQGEMIVIETYIPDTCSNIQITCTTSEGEITRYLFQSGKDGSILLLDE